MKYSTITGMILFIGNIANAVAGGCADAGYTTSQSPSVLSGKRIMAVAGKDTWNEDHCSSGALYKLGDGTAADPRAYRGNWTFSRNSTSVTYNYTVGGNSSYTWGLWSNPTDGSLCWENASGGIVATAPKPGPAGSPCDHPAPSLSF